MEVYNHTNGKPRHSAIWLWKEVANEAPSV